MKRVLGLGDVRVGAVEGHICQGFPCQVILANWAQLTRLVHCVRLGSRWLRLVAST